MNITRIGVMSVPVSDPEVAKAFYTEKLGFQVAMDNPMGENMRWIMLTPPKGGTNITLTTWFPNFKPGTLTGTVLETENLEADAEALTEKGVQISAIESAPWGKWVTFNDPDGNGWVLQQNATF